MEAEEGEGGRGGGGGCFLIRFATEYYTDLPRAGTAREGKD